MPAKGANKLPLQVKKSGIIFNPGISAQKLIMKKLLLGSIGCMGLLCGMAQTKKSFNDTAYLKPIEVLAIRAADNAPFAKTNISQKEIEKINLGQDLPYLLNQTPSTVINSDAGNGIGYTGIRIRGTDATRINVTLNGIPYNDAESQGTYFVDLPDFSSSANSIQVQRGVGTSSNGSGSFGGSINLATNELNKDFYAELNNSAGSYNSFKNNFKFGSGLLGKHVTIDARLSKISSDGYIDRASSDLKSAYLSTAYTDQKNSLRFNIFTGKEKTYQAWDGVPESFLATNRTYNSSGQEQANIPYDNETDNYTQTHYQLFYNHEFNKYWKINTAVFFTKGKGYYEQYKGQSKLSGYNLPDYSDGTNLVKKTDLIRRLWLDNNFYGGIFSVQHQKNKTQFTAGGGWNKYDGKHFGEIIWAKVTAAVPANYRWYNLTAFKTDFSLYTKWTEQWNNNWQSYFDVQFRTVNYRINGFRNNPSIILDNSYHFINPKLGITYTKNNWKAYASYAIGGKEPNREDFESGITQQPKKEFLQDIEMGFENNKKAFSYSANFYYMKYTDQLVLVGNINDVGAYTRINVPNSYRLGLEIQGRLTLCKYANITANLSISKNKIQNFTELIDDYDNGGTKSNFYKSTDIAFSPSVITGGAINFFPIKNAAISLISKYVGRQYMDNTSQQSRSLNPYYVQDIRLSYLMEKKFFKATNFILQLNNVFNKKYEANGYTFSYIYGSLTTENFYFPMAPFNFMVGINIKL